jgi:hypothetical protein
VGIIKEEEFYFFVVSIKTHEWERENEFI